MFLIRLNWNFLSYFFYPLPFSDFRKQPVISWWLIYMSLPRDECFSLKDAVLECIETSIARKKINFLFAQNGPMSLKCPGFLVR